MKQKVRYILLIAILFLVSSTYAQEEDRLAAISKRMEELAASTTPGLNEKVDFSVAGASIQEFLRGLAESHNLNVSVDPTMEIRIYNNFTNERVLNVLLFLVNEYKLDVRFVGSIMSFYKYEPPEKPKPKPVPKELVVKYTPGAEFLTLDLKNDTLFQVVKKIASVSDKNVIISPEVPVDKLLNVYIRNVTFDAALNRMAFANGLVVEKTEDEFYIIGLKPKELVTEEGEEELHRRRRPKKDGEGKTPIVLEDGQFYLEVKDSLGEKFVTFEAVNVPIADAINEVSNVTGNSYVLFSEPKGNTTTKVVNVRYDDFLSYLLQGTNHTFKVDDNIYLVGERRLEGLRDTRVVKLQHRSMEDVMAAIPAELREGVDVKEFQELNSFILSGSSPQIVEIESFIEELDVVVPMVMIEVIVVEINRKKIIEAGVEMGKADTVSGGGSLIPGLDYVFDADNINDGLANSPLNLGRVTPDFYVRLKALETQNYANVRSVPKLATLNGHQATLSIGQTRYYKIETQNVVGSLNPQTIVTPQWNSIQADLKIDIKPLVSGDDQVTLDIQTGISDFLDTPVDNAPPPSSTSQFNSMIRVKNEEMVLLGGLERVSKAESGSGVPFISRIPILKWFFGKRSKVDDKTIFVIFVKPTIIY